MFMHACAPPSTTHTLLTWQRAQGILEVEKNVEAPAAPRSHDHLSKGAGEHSRVAGKRGRSSKDMLLGQKASDHGVGISSVMEGSGGGSSIGGSGSGSMNGSGPRRDQGALSDMDYGHL